MAREQSWGLEGQITGDTLVVKLAYLHTGIGRLGRDLEVAHATLSEHHGRVGVDLDGFSEQSDGFVPFTLSEENYKISYDF